MITEWTRELRGQENIKNREDRRTVRTEKGRTLRTEDGRT